MVSDNFASLALIREALQRSSLADSFMRPQPDDRQLPDNQNLFVEFRLILKSFLNLQNPIVFRKADSFIAAIAERLGQFDYIYPYGKTKGFDEPKALIQLLFYMHEKYIRSRETFRRLTEACNLDKSFLDLHIDVINHSYSLIRVPTRKIYDFFMVEHGSCEDGMPNLKVLAQDGLLIPLLSEMSRLP